MGLLCIGTATLFSACSSRKGGAGGSGVSNKTGWNYNDPKLGGFDEFYKFAADSKLMDQIATLGKVILSNRVLSKFQIGGTSGKNFGKVLMEIAQHRGTKRGLKFFLNHYKLVLKNKIRLMILKLEPVFIEEIMKRTNRL
jgi:hypothetical protein